MQCRAPPLLPTNIGTTQDPGLYLRSCDLADVDEVKHRVSAGEKLLKIWNKKARSDAEGEEIEKHKRWCNRARAVASATCHAYLSHRKFTGVYRISSVAEGRELLSNHRTLRFLVWVDLTSSATKAAAAAALASAAACTAANKAANAVSARA